MQSTAEFNRLAIEHLLRGLPDQELASEIFSRKPMDLSETVEMINWHQACRSFTYSSSKQDIREEKTENYMYAEKVSKTGCDAGFSKTFVKKKKTKSTPENVGLLCVSIQNTTSETVQTDSAGQLYKQAHNMKRNAKPRLSKCYHCRTPGHRADVCPVKAAQSQL